MDQSNLPCAVILTALPVEYQAVRAHMSNLYEETHPVGTIYGRGAFVAEKRTWEVAVAQVGAGNPGAASEGERAIMHFHPNVVLFVGVAGGLKDVRLGDVVAATKVYNYESGKADIDFQPRPEVGNVTYPMEQRAKAEAKEPRWLQRMKGPIPDPVPRVFVGAIAAGEKVISSTRSNERKRLQRYNGDALAVEMEGYGFLKAAHAHPSVHTLIVRGISDLIDNKGEVDAANYQEIAARHASAFAFEILAKFDVEAVSPSSKSESRTTKKMIQPIQNTGKYNTQIKGRSVHHFVQGDNARVNIHYQNDQKEK